MCAARKRSILLVEDHRATARALGKYLDAVGYAVHIALDAASARKLAAAKPIEIVVCDINLPDGNGWDLMRELNGERSRPGIAISGFGSMRDLERSKQAGFAKHLVKPFSPEELIEALDALVAAKNDSLRRTAAARRCD